MTLSLPNLLTYARIAMVPAVVALYPLDGTLGHWLSFGVFVLASITDFFDGYLARAWQQQSALGRMLDPIADKLLVAAVLLVLVSYEVVAGFGLWAALIILCREILVSGLREFLAELKVSVPVSRLAKWKTAIQMVALALLLLGPAGDTLIGGVSVAGVVLLWVAALLTLYTGYDYFRAGVRHAVAADQEPASPNSQVKTDP